MTTRIFVPRDSGAISLGADETAAAIAACAAREQCDLEIVRTGSRGLYWLEPLVEIQCGPERIGYGPVTAQEVPGLFAAHFLSGASHPLRRGPIACHPYLARQHRLTFARVGIVDPASLSDYLAHAGFEGLRKALAMSPGAIVEAVTDSGLRGRGGAAFPTGIKWKTALDQTSPQKYIACNADEGDSGTFADRMLMEGDPFLLIEGMIIAGLAVGATQGYIYLRAEYPHADRALREAIAACRAEGYLGDNVLGSGKRFNLDVRLGAGAYICGEETSMLESLEGRRGEVRVRPPMPAIRGLFGMPTVVNNVLSLATVPAILAHGSHFYHDLGIGRSRGTVPIQLAGNIRHGGLIEVPFGLTLKELLYDLGGGSATGRPLRCAQIGGPLGAYVPASQFDVAMDYEALSARGALLGHGGIVAFDDTVDMARMARHALAFCAHESCGKCTPCRVGSTRGVELLDGILGGSGGHCGVGASADTGSRSPDSLALLDDLCETLLQTSLCGLGGMAPFPVRSAIQHFPEDFQARAPVNTADHPGDF